jgi:hypothetical protein
MNADSKSRSKRAPLKQDAEISAWMTQYGLAVWQLDKETVAHLRACTELGREIMLIMMRLEMHPFTAKTKANASVLGREHLRILREKRAVARASKSKETRKQRDRAAWVRKQIAAAERRVWVEYGDWSDEPGPQVGRMIELARKVA